MKNIYYICSGSKTLQLKKEELPDPPDNYVAVKYLYCGICGGDYSTYIGRRNLYPVSLGHEFIAEIIKIGNKISDLTVGQKVISDFNYRCGKCQYCRTGRSHLCVENNIQLFSNRAFSQYGFIHREYLTVVPQMSNWTLACFIEPLSCVLHAFMSFPHNPMSHIFINGTGSIGTMAVFYLCQILHYKNIYVYDVNEVRLNNIIQCFDVQNFMSKNIMPDIIIECTNQADGAAKALQAASPGTTLCMMSHLYGIDTSFIYEEICKKEIHAYFPLRNGDRTNLYKATDFILKYWHDKFNILLGVYNDLNYIFKAKNSIPQNKHVFDIINADWDLND